jgi:glycosyltransferase 2 family protein
MKNQIIKVFKIIIPIAIGIYLTWYFISNSSPSEREYYIKVFKEANYGWIFIALVLAFLSHLSRAYRWKFLLQPLGYQPKLSIMYHSVMIGYILNLTIPRSGELARAAYFSKHEKTSPDRIFGTIIVERVVDLLMFGLVFAIALYLQVDEDQFNNTISNNDESSSLPSWVVPVVLGFFAIALLLVLGIEKLRNKAVKFVKGVIEGCLTILKLKQKVAYILHTLFIWIAYVAMFWVTALAIPEMDTISVNALFACFVAGAIAIGITPGGIGLYPLMVSAVLVNMYEFQGEIAKSFSMLMWSSQTLFIVVLGILSLFLIKDKKEV